MSCCTRPRVLGLCLGLFACVCSFSGSARADGILTFKFTPAPRTQLAVWIEDADGKFLATVALTEAVAYRGIGNRPGASLMNSGYRWPYGRREGVLPIWAHRRASAPGAKLFPRVIFQDRIEGHASKRTLDESNDNYYCLSFDQMESSRDKLDAVSCASQFSSDKGRYLTQDDVDDEYYEPWEDMKAGRDGAEPQMIGSRKTLPLKSLYPPRMDVTHCTGDPCYDHPDVDRFAADARNVMPEIDAVSLATPPGDVQQSLLFTVPPDWPDGAYTAYVEVGLEGDYNKAWNDKTFPTPFSPEDDWDSFAEFYGYPYRGQPSLVWKIPFWFSADSRAQFSTDAPEGRSSWDVWNENYGAPEVITAGEKDALAISADAPMSGVDRLREGADGKRVVLEARGASADGELNSSGEAPVGIVEDLRVTLHPNKLRAHTWVLLHLKAVRSDIPLHAYEVRVSTEPIVDEDSFIRGGRQAKTATDDAEGATLLSLPTDVSAGEPIDTAIGDLVANTRYFIGVRATDELNRHGPISITEVTTPPRQFATVTPCFIATAAYGSPMTGEVGVLRHVRDRYLMPNEPGRAAVQAYYAIGARAAEVIAARPVWRSMVRAFVDPLVRISRLLP